MDHNEPGTERSIVSGVRTNPVRLVVRAWRATSVGDHPRKRLNFATASPLYTSEFLRPGTSRHPLTEDRGPVAAGAFRRLGFALRRDEDRPPVVAQVPELAAQEDVGPCPRAGGGEAAGLRVARPRLAFGETAHIGG